MPASIAQAKTIPGAKFRPPPPPLPKKALASWPSVVTQQPASSVPSALAICTQPTSIVAPKSPIIPPQPEIDPEEEKIRARAEFLYKQREEHASRLRQVEQEEEEASQAGDSLPRSLFSTFTVYGLSPTVLEPTLHHRRQSPTVSILYVHCLRTVADSLGTNFTPPGTVSHGYYSLCSVSTDNKFALPVTVSHDHYPLRSLSVPNSLKRPSASLSTSRCFSKSSFLPVNRRSRCSWII
jgi:hypothetical protein